MNAAENLLGSKVEFAFEYYRTQVDFMHKCKKRNGREFGV